MSELARLLERCLKCSCCQSACPVATHDADYLGPKVLGPDLMRFGYAGARRGGGSRDKVLLDSLEMCSGCQRCDLACPYGVPVAQLIRRNKEALQSETQGNVQGTFSLRDKFLAHPERLGRIGTALAPLANTALRSTVLSKIMRGMLGMNITQPVSFAPKKELLRPSLVQPMKQKTINHAMPTTPSTRVLYFPGCHVNYQAPEVGTAFLNLLETLGIKALITERLCCGMPLLAAGDRQQAHETFQRNLRYFEEYIEQGYDIVTTCPSCSLTLKKFYAEEMNSEQAQQLAGAVYDFSEYLEPYSSRLAALDLPAAEEAVAYHLPCHTLAQGTGMKGVNLIKQVPGIELQIVDSCCGQSGTYGYKAENEGVSMAIGKSLAEQLRAVDPGVILTPCGSCKDRISFVTGLKTLHPVQILNGSGA